MLEESSKIININELQEKFQKSKELLILNNNFDNSLYKNEE